MEFTDGMIRANLKRCAAWMGKLCTEIGGEDCPDSAAAVVISCWRTAKEVITVARSEATRAELLEALERCIPWMYDIIKGGYHKECARPDDAVAALDQAIRMVYPDGVPREDI